MAKNQWIVLEQALVKSKAWLALKRAKSIQVYLIFRTKCRPMKNQRKQGAKAQWTIANNGEIEFTYDEAENKYGIARKTFTATLDELVEKGFIDITATGMGLYKNKSLYAISDRWKEYGTSAFQQKERPKRQTKVGFRKGNNLGRNCQKKKKSSVANNTGSSVTRNTG